MIHRTRSLMRDVLVRTLAVGIVVTIVLSAAAYLTTYTRRTRETLSVLRQLVSERVERETAIFSLARDNLNVFRDAFLRLYLDDRVSVSDADFDRLYIRGDDGAVRMRRKFFDGVYDTSGHFRYGVSSFIGNNQPVDDADFRRRLVLSYRLLSQLGPGFQTRFANTHVSFPENAITLFWPDVPWGLQARADLPMNELGVIAATLQDRNPEREPVWTGLYFDDTADEWMITYEVPVDHDGRHLINPSHDVPLTDLMTRLRSGRARAGYAFLMREDGYLVARPTPPSEDQKWVGQLSFDEIGDPAIVRSYEAIRSALNDHPAALENDGTIVVDNAEDDAYLTVGRLEGPDWWFVDVYPKSEIRAAAHRAALERLGESVILLVVLMLVFFVLVRRRAARPLAQLRTAAEYLGEARFAEVAHGDVPLPRDLDNEIGLTARRFYEMSARILDANREMERVVEERTRELLTANEALRELSILDGLTGIHNRRAFDRDLSALVREAVAGTGSFGLIMIDLDQFKLFNDSHGHQEGDEALVRVSTRVAEVIRREDRVYRYGGEELAVLCPDTDLTATTATAERIVRQVSTLEVPFPESVHGVVTVSAGAAAWTGELSTPGEIVKSADTRLYAAKQAGRNRVGG